MNSNNKYIFVTGGVVSSLGKGIASAAIATLLANAGLSVTMIKMDPYINVDPGTMSPYEHGEVFVTSDGAETDLDLGHYERFLNIALAGINNCTSGRVYSTVIEKERKGEYLGNTVQIVPHITDEIKERIYRASEGYDVCVVEIGGTVGDIESLPFLEAIRQIRIECGLINTLFMHLTLVPYMESSQEIKTKPTQRSVKELCGLGIQPDFLMCRSVNPLSEAIKHKIALFTNSTPESIISLSDVDNVYTIPLLLNNQGLGQMILRRLGFDRVPETIKLEDWERVKELSSQASREITVAMVGKYTAYADAYKSINEALRHAGWQQGAKVKIKYCDASDLERSGTDILRAADAILIPGGFGVRGTDGMLLAIKYAREHKVPCFGICFGMQLMVVEFARNVVGWQDAHSTELDPNTTHPVILWQEERIQGAGADIHKEHLGGSMRLGAHACQVKEGSLLSCCYPEGICSERYRHRYEANSALLSELEKSGLQVSGRSQEGLAMVVEISDHPWFLGCQFHPEFTSNPRVGHPLFNSFIAAAVEFNKCKEQ